MNRFWHSYEKSKEHAKEWSVFGLGWVYLSLELGLLAGASLRKLVFSSGGGSAAASSSSTAADRPQVEDKALRGAVLNSVVLAVLFLGGRARLFRLRLILCVAAPVEQWCRHQAHHCRAVRQNAAWFIVQASGEFFAHILTVAKVLTIERDLRWCGFSLPAQADECISDPGLMFIQDEMAKQMADLTWSMVTARLLRGMWIMRG